MSPTETKKTKTNLELLLDFFHDDIWAIHQRPPPSVHDIITDNRRCIRVFAILLEKGYGKLIKFFRDAHIFDEDLPNLNTSSPKYKNLTKDLKNRNVDNPGRVIDAFESAKWSYCPVTITFGLEEMFERGHILPFMRMEAVNEKGGTASVYQVCVQKEFIDPKLRKVLNRAAYTDPEFGEVSQDRR